MALFNHLLREVHAKIVYYGPGGGGKETSIAHIHRHLNTESRSNVKALSVQGNRMLFFDYTPAESTVEGYGVRVHLYTVVDEVRNSSPWAIALKGSDGVIFVADSAPERQQENLDRLRDLRGLLAAAGYDIDNLPFVIQYNRRDHADAVSLAELQRSLNRGNAPGFPTVATVGEGVRAPLSCLTRMILANIRDTLEEQAEEQEAAAVEYEFEFEEEAELVTGGVEDIRLEITGGGLLEEGRLSVPLTVTVGADRRDFRLVISLVGAAR